MALVHLCCLVRQHILRIQNIFQKLQGSNLEGIIVTFDLSNSVLKVDWTTYRRHATIPLFGSMGMQAVGRAGRRWQSSLQVGRQFKKYPGIMKRKQKPDYANIVDLTALWQLLKK